MVILNKIFFKKIAEKNPLKFKEICNLKNTYDEASSFSFSNAERIHGEKPCHSALMAGLRNHFTKKVIK